MRGRSWTKGKVKSFSAHAIMPIPSTICAPFARGWSASQLTPLSVAQLPAIRLKRREGGGQVLLIDPPASHRTGIHRPGNVW